MNHSDKEKSRIETETRLLNRELDFPGSYMAVKTLDQHIRRSPASVTGKTVQALVHVIESGQFESQKQVLFLYREASQALADILYFSKEEPGLAIIAILQELLEKSTGKQHQAVAQTLASLPLAIAGPMIPSLSDSAVYEITFRQLVSMLGITDPEKMTWKGRSLTGEALNKKTGIIKFLKKEDNPLDITFEAWWMEFLNSIQPGIGTKFDIPVPVKIEGLSLLKISGIPETILSGSDLHPECLAIAFRAASDYFRYPNENYSDTRISKEELKEIICRNAWLFGKTTSMGIVHTAPIPLFHNRVQQDRRQDHGFYEWERGGRLDRWLDSCRHPNFAASGLRDFEHLTNIENCKNLNHYIGSHILSLILVTGSYFRNKNPEAKGTDAQGNPVDTRNLFDPDLLEDIVRTAFIDYYHGFTGSRPSEKHSHLPGSLIDKLIREMGRDQHMEEILRTEDQNSMNENDFQTFLLERGLSPHEITSLQKGQEEIIMQTGPHLGGFNQGISVPELIDFLFSCTAWCVSGRYAVENGLKQYV